MKVNGGPAISFRTMPGMIFKRTCKSLDIPILRKKFSSEEKAQYELDNRLNAGEPAACQVGVYYLPYFPKEYRFHFNAHNLIVVGKEGDDYLISDPIMETLVTMSSYELKRVRFAKSLLAPRGQLYYPRERRPVTDEQIKAAIVTGIKRNVRDMLHIPGNFAGISGIRFTAKKIKMARLAGARKIAQLPGTAGAHAGRNRHRWRRVPVYIWCIPPTGSCLPPAR